MPLFRRACVHALACAVFGLAGCPPSAPPQPVETPKAEPEAEPGPFKWTAPLCYAYSPRADGYACLDFSLTTDATGPTELAPMDFTRFEPVPDTSFGGHKAIQLIADETSLLSIADKPYDSTSPVKQVQTEMVARREARDQGYDKPVPLSQVLEPGQWVDFHGLSLRFRTQYHIGDASEYDIGSLQMLCPEAPVSSAIELLEDQRGGRAVAFAAPDARSIITSVIATGGGEGSWYFHTINIRVDIDKRCNQ